MSKLLRRLLIWYLGVTFQLATLNLSPDSKNVCWDTFLFSLISHVPVSSGVRNPLHAGKLHRKKHFFGGFKMFSSVSKAAFCKRFRCQNRLWKGLQKVLILRLTSKKQATNKYHNKRHQNIFWVYIPWKTGQDRSTKSSEYGQEGRTLGRHRKRAGQKGKTARTS